MTSEILNVVIDEREDLEQIDVTSLMNMNYQRSNTLGNTAGGSRRIFKDYLLSSEVFYLDSSLLN